jgi:hypothetical protein
MHLLVFVCLFVYYSIKLKIELLGSSVGAIFDVLLWIACSRIDNTYQVAYIQLIDVPNWMFMEPRKQEMDFRFAF